MPFNQSYTTPNYLSSLQNTKSELEGKLTETKKEKAVPILNFKPQSVPWASNFKDVVADIPTPKTTPAPVTPAPQQPQVEEEDLLQKYLQDTEQDEDSKRELMKALEDGVDPNELISHLQTQWYEWPKQSVLWGLAERTKDRFQTAAKVGRQDIATQGKLEWAISTWVAGWLAWMGTLFDAWFTWAIELLKVVAPEKVEEAVAGGAEKLAETLAPLWEKINEFAESSPEARQLVDKAKLVWEWYAWPVWAWAVWRAVKPAIVKGWKEVASTAKQVTEKIKDKLPAMEKVKVNRAKNKVDKWEDILFEAVNPTTRENKAVLKRRVQTLIPYIDDNPLNNSLDKVKARIDDSKDVALKNMKDYEENVWVKWEVKTGDIVTKLKSKYQEKIWDSFIDSTEAKIAQDLIETLEWFWKVLKDADIIKVRRAWDKIERKNKGFMVSAESSSKWDIIGEANKFFREEIRKSNPEYANYLKEYSTTKSIGDIIGATIERRVGQQKWGFIRKWLETTARITWAWTGGLPWYIASEALVQGSKALWSSAFKLTRGKKLLQKWNKALEWDKVKPKIPKDGVDNNANNLTDNSSLWRRVDIQKQEEIKSNSPKLAPEKKTLALPQKSVTPKPATVTPQTIERWVVLDSKKEILNTKWNLNFRKLQNKLNDSDLDLESIQKTMDFWKIEELDQGSLLKFLNAQDRQKSILRQEYEQWFSREMSWDEFRKSKLDELLVDEEKIYQTLSQIENAKAGERIFIEWDVWWDYNVLWQASSFPKWVSSDLRDSKLFNKTLAYINNSDIIPEKNSRMRALADEIYSEINPKLQWIYEDTKWIQDFSKQSGKSNTWANKKLSPEKRGKSDATKNEVSTKWVKKESSQIDIQKPLQNLTTKNVFNTSNTIAKQLWVPVKKVQEVIKEFIDKYGDDIKNKLWELADEIADRVWARAKFMDDKGTWISGKIDDISELEKDLIFEYTNSWGGTSKVMPISRQKEVSKAIEKLPNNNEVVYSGQKMTNEQISELFYAPDDIFTTKRLISSSTDKKTARDFMEYNPKWKNKVMLEFPKGWKNISELSAFQKWWSFSAENEVLFPIWQKFKVEVIDKSNNHYKLTPIYNQANKKKLAPKKNIKRNSDKYKSEDIKDIEDAIKTQWADGFDYDISKSAIEKIEEPDLNTDYWNSKEVRLKIWQIKSRIKSWDKMPPIVVTLRWWDNVKPYEIIDGLHRYRAYKELWIKDIELAIPDIQSSWSWKIRIITKKLAPKK